MTEIRIMTVRQPYSWAIIHGGKDVENRRRNIAGDYRGPVLIHAGLQHHEGGWIRLVGGYPPFKGSNLAHYVQWKETMIGSVGNYRGHILGVVDLVDTHRAWGCFEQSLGKARHCSPWAEDFDGSGWHLRLENPRPLPTPIPWKGRLGLTTLETDCLACHGKAYFYSKIGWYPERCPQCHGTGEAIPGLRALL